MEQSTENGSRCVVRLRTSIWSDRKGLYVRKTLSYMRKHCYGLNLLEEELGSVGPIDTLERIANIGTCDDGLYEVKAYNESYDYETGYIDNYDLRLVPFQPTVVNV